MNFEAGPMPGQGEPVGSLLLNAARLIAKGVGTLEHPQSVLQGSAIVFKLLDGMCESELAAILVDPRCSKLWKGSSMNTNNLHHGYGKTTYHYKTIQIQPNC